MLLAQWVDLSARRRAEQARADLLVEQAARTQAEAMAERLSKLQALSGAIESLSLDELLAELAVRLAELFERADRRGRDRRRRRGADRGPRRARRGAAVDARDEARARRRAVARGADLIEGARVGVLRLGLRAAGDRSPPAERSLLHDAAERAALASGARSCTSEEHRIAVELQRGLLPKQPARDRRHRARRALRSGGLGAEVGGDWYDAFALPGGRLGVVVGDVAGRGIPAASAMGQLRSVTRAFALADDGVRSPGEVLTRLNRHQLALGQNELFTVVYAIVDPPSGRSRGRARAIRRRCCARATAATSYLEGGEGLMGIEDIVYEDLQRRPARGGDRSCSTPTVWSSAAASRSTSGFERLADAVADGPADPAALREHVLAAVPPAEAELHDDVTALFVKLR